MDESQIELPWYTLNLALDFFILVFAQHASWTRKEPLRGIGHTSQIFPTSWLM